MDSKLITDSLISLEKPVKIFQASLLKYSFMSFPSKYSEYGF